MSAPGAVPFVSWGFELLFSSRIPPFHDLLRAFTKTEIAPKL